MVSEFTRSSANRFRFPERLRQADLGQIDGSTATEIVVPHEVARRKQPQRIGRIEGVSVYIGVAVDSAREPNRIFLREPAHRRCIDSRAVVIEVRTIVLSSSVLEGVAR